MSTVGAVVDGTVVTVGIADVVVASVVDVAAVAGVGRVVTDADAADVGVAASLGVSPFSEQAARRSAAAAALTEIVLMVLPSR